MDCKLETWTLCKRRHMFWELTVSPARRNWLPTRNNLRRSRPNSHPSNRLRSQSRKSTAQNKLQNRCKKAEELGFFCNYYSLIFIKAKIASQPSTIKGPQRTTIATWMPVTGIVTRITTKTIDKVGTTFMDKTPLQRAKAEIIANF